jgi:hypothetical protein
MNVRIILVGCLLCSMSVAAQSGKQKLDNAKREAKEQRQRGFGGQRTESDLKDEKQKLPSNQQNKTDDGVPDPADNDQQQKSGSSSKEIIQRNNDQSTAQNKSSSDSSGNQSTPPAVIQRTTSESGSPSMLSADNGRGRDGTNNVQRSSINVAGSPMRGNYNLDRKNRGEQDQNTDAPRIQKPEERPSAGIPKNNANGKASGGGNKTEQSKSKSARQKG